MCHIFEAEPLSVFNFLQQFSELIGCTPRHQKSVVGGSDIGWLQDGLDGGVLLAPVSDMGELGSDFDQ